MQVSLSQSDVKNKFHIVTEDKVENSIKNLFGLVGVHKYWQWLGIAGSNIILIMNNKWVLAFI